MAMKLHVILWAFITAIPLLGQPKDVGFSLDAPDEVYAGNAFEVTLTFTKGDLDDYARFSQDLPSGFTASNIAAPNGDFTFSDQRIRIIWLKLPEEPVLEIRYSIDVHEQLSGQLELFGTFAYVHKGNRAYMNLGDPVTVNILPNPDIDPDQVVDISEFNTLKTPVNIRELPGGGEAEEDFLTVVRQKPVKESNGMVYVNLLVRKPADTDFLKLEESVPGGYAFESLEAGGAVVTQDASSARFVWMPLPEQEVIMVRYRLVPILEASQDPLVLKGTLSFTEDGDSKTVDVREMPVNLKALSRYQQEEFLHTGVIPEERAEKRVRDVERRDPRPETPAAEKEDRDQIQEAGQQPTTGKPAAEQTDRVIPGPSDYRKYPRSAKSTIIDIEPLEVVPGVTFRVQVAAVRYPYFPRVYFAYFDLLRAVQVELIDGWNKYTVGSFSTYEEAAKHKNRIIAETPEHSSFIVAYRDGKRVPVADVL